MLNSVESIKAYELLKDYINVFKSQSEYDRFAKRQTDTDGRIYEEINVFYFDKHKDPLIEEDLFENFEYFGFRLYATTPDTGVYLRRYLN